MQRFMVAAATLLCLAQALPQNYKYNPEEAKKYVDDYNPEAAKKYVDEYNPEEAKNYVNGNPYVNDPENYGKAWSYAYDAAKNTNAFSYDAQAENQYAFAYDPSKNEYAFAYDPSKNEYAFAYDPANQETFEFGSAGSLEDLVGALEAITSSSLFSQALGECKILQTLPGVISEASAEITARRGDLENAFKGLERSRSAQAVPGAAVRQLSTAIGSIEPLIPIISKLFTFDDSCKFGAEAA